MQSSARLSRLGAASLAALLALAGAITPAAAWSNGPDGGNGYGSHDWILDQSLRLLSARGVSTSWVDRTVAMLATDNPDKVEVAADPDREIEHVYTGGGKRGGAVHRITEHYAAILKYYNAGKAAQVAGNDAAAEDAFDDASYNLGMLAHFYGDIAQPFHTSRDAIGQTTTHKAYELLVDDDNRHPTDAPSWSVANSSWVVKDMPDVRKAALAMAAYSRARYQALAADFHASDSSLHGDAATVTKEVLIRASGDLANLISSVPKGIGNPPAIGSITLKLRYQGVKTNEGSERLDGTVLDVSGKPIEGIRVDIKWPMPDGSFKTMPFWTDDLGVGHIYGTIGSNTYMKKFTVTATVKSNYKTLTKSTWFYRTKRLSDGTAGFSTTISDSTVVSGQTITVTATAKSSGGTPVVGLLITFSWYIGSSTITATAYTDSAGKAKSIYKVTGSTPQSGTSVTARTQAYSISRSSSKSFHRVD